MNRHARRREGKLTRDRRKSPVVQAAVSALGKAVMRMKAERTPEAKAEAQAAAEALFTATRTPALDRKATRLERAQRRP